MATILNSGALCRLYFGICPPLQNVLFFFFYPLLTGMVTFYSSFKSQLNHCLKSLLQSTPTRAYTHTLTWYPLSYCGHSFKKYLLSACYVLNVVQATDSQRLSCNFIIRNLLLIRTGNHKTMWEVLSWKYLSIRFSEQCHTYVYLHAFSRVFPFVWYPRNYLSLVLSPCLFRGPTPTRKKKVLALWNQVQQMLHVVHFYSKHYNHLSLF